MEDSPKYFRVVPASSSGKYHPAYALGDGGLVRHTIAAVKIGAHICNLEFLRINDTTRDDILTALFIHDTRKQGLTDDASEGHTVDDHAKLASTLVEDPVVAGMVRAHMGQWGKNKPGNTPQFIVHLADYLASRKDLEVKF